MFCACLFICALWSPAGKGLTSWLSFVVSTVSLSLSHGYPGSGVVLNCIDSSSLHPYLLCLHEIADTRVFARSTEAAKRPYKKISSCAVDTDVVVLVIHVVQQL